MEFVQLISVQQANQPDCYNVYIEAKQTGESDAVTMPYHLLKTDTVGLAPDIQTAIEQWISEGKEILPVELPPEPSTDPNDYPLQRYQFDRMLRTLGQTLVTVETAIDAVIADPAANADAKSRLHTGGLNERWDRSSPLFDLLGPTLNIQPEDIDAAWMVAKDFR